MHTHLAGLGQPHRQGGGGVTGQRRTKPEEGGRARTANQAVGQLFAGWQGRNWTGSVLSLLHQLQGRRCTRYVLQNAAWRPRGLGCVQPTGRHADAALTSVPWQCAHRWPWIQSARPQGSAVACNALVRSSGRHGRWLRQERQRRPAHSAAARSIRSKANRAHAPPFSPSYWQAAAAHLRHIEDVVGGAGHHQQRGAVGGGGHARQAQHGVVVQLELHD